MNPQLHAIHLDAPSGYMAPREVLSQRGAASLVGPALRRWGTPPGKVLVVADAAVADAGLIAPVTAGLADAGFEPTVFSDVAGEPTGGLADRAGRRARSVGVAAVVGVGGGSAMDLAKVVALQATNDGEASSWLGAINPPKPVAPLALVPTTTGTGSEATRIAMITIAGGKRVVSCTQFVPLLAVLDPDLVSGLPGPVVASTGMDALAHALESMMSGSRTPLTLALATEAAALLHAHLEPAVLADDVDARGRLLYAAHLAGLALNAGVVIGHSLAYVVARHSPMPHGTSCALALPYCLAYNLSMPPGVADAVAAAASGGRTTDIDVAARYVGDLSARLGLPSSLEGVGIAASELDLMALETVRDYPRPTNPRPLEEQPIRELLEYMHAGDVAGACRASHAGDA